jgi:hypothetical protein
LSKTSVNYFHLKILALKAGFVTYFAPSLFCTAYLCIFNVCIIFKAEVVNQRFLKLGSEDQSRNCPQQLIRNTGRTLKFDNLGFRDNRKPKIK